MTPMQISADLAQKAHIEQAFAEGNVLDYKPGKSNHLSKPDIDHAVRMGPGKKGVLPEKKRDASHDPIRMRPVVEA